MQCVESPFASQNGRIPKIICVIPSGEVTIRECLLALPIFALASGVCVLPKRGEGLPFLLALNLARVSSLILRFLRRIFSIVSGECFLPRRMALLRAQYSALRFFTRLALRVFSIDSGERFFPRV